MKDLYKMLGVAENADEATIKKAYRKLAKEYHPDVTGNDKKKTERFKEINEAYGVLGDKEEAQRSTSASSTRPIRPDGMPEGFDAEAFARTFGGIARRRAAASSFESDFDLGDLFATPLRRRRRARRPRSGGGARARPARGADVIGHAAHHLHRGGARDGKRSVRSGSGSTVEVTFPPGVESGGRLRVPGHGQPAPAAGRRARRPLSGDRGPPRSAPAAQRLRHRARRARDVQRGGPRARRSRSRPSKGRVTVTVPPGTSSGARLRLRGKGVKKADGTRGDQIVRVEIVAPKGAATTPRRESCSRNSPAGPRGRARGRF